MVLNRKGCGIVVYVGLLVVTVPISLAVTVRISISGVAVIRNSIDDDSNQLQVRSSDFVDGSVNQATMVFGRLNDEHQATGKS